MNAPTKHHEDDLVTGERWDEQEQQRIDDLSSDPVLDRIPARKSKGKAKRLLNLLDSLSSAPEGGRL